MNTTHPINKRIYKNEKLCAVSHDMLVCAEDTTSRPKWYTAKPNGAYLYAIISFCLKRYIFFARLFGKVCVRVCVRAYLHTQINAIKTQRHKTWQTIYDREQHMFTLRITTFGPIATPMIHLALPVHCAGLLILLVCFCHSANKEEEEEDKHDRTETIYCLKCSMAQVWHARIFLIPSWRLRGEYTKNIIHILILQNRYISHVCVSWSHISLSIHYALHIHFFLSGSEKLIIHEVKNSEITHHN